MNDWKAVPIPGGYPIDSKKAIGLALITAHWARRLEEHPHRDQMDRRLGTGIGPSVGCRTPPLTLRTSWLERTMGDGTPRFRQPEPRVQGTALEQEVFANISRLVSLWLVSVLDRSLGQHASFCLMTSPVPELAPLGSAEPGEPLGP